MFTEAGILFFYAETPVHPGSGAGLGPIDLPVQRERFTGYPIIRASGVKGALRDLACQRLGVGACRREIAALRDELRSADRAEDKGLLKALEDKSQEMRRLNAPVAALFGPEEAAAEHGGAVAFTDARLLLFPVRSLKGVFGWVTSPAVLSRFCRDAAAARVEAWRWELPEVKEGEALVGASCPLVLDGGGLVLEEYAFAPRREPAVGDVARWLAERVFPKGEAHAYVRQKLYREGEKGGAAGTSLVVLSDDAFRDFTLLATEVSTRIRLDPVLGTVAGGALWTEEHLPPESLLYSLILAADARVPASALPDELKEDGRGRAARMLSYLDQRVLSTGLLQLGGDETVGRGFVSMRFCRDDGKGAANRECSRTA